MALTLAQAGERVEARIKETPRGSGFEGMRSMFAAAGLDPDEAFSAISGISGGVPSPLTEEQHEALLTGLTIALLAGYEAASGGDLIDLWVCPVCHDAWRAEPESENAHCAGAGPQRAHTRVYCNRLKARVI